MINLSTEKKEELCSKVAFRLKRKFGRQLLIPGDSFKGETLFFIHAGKDRITSQILPKYVICQIKFSGSSLIFLGLAICGDKDIWNTETGLNLAYVRAVRNMLIYTNNLNDRASFQEITNSTELENQIKGE